MSIAGDVFPVGDAAVLAVVSESISAESSAKVWSLHAALRDTFGKAVLDVVPGYASVLVRFDPAVTRSAIVMATVRGAMERAEPSARAGERTVQVGVCFSPEHALDLDELVQRTGLSREEVVAEFCRPLYHVAFLGFTAGFPYMIGLSPKLDAPRLATPRVRVPAGSVGLAAGQCGIYPRVTPGGWRIVGKTSAPIFDPSRDAPALFRAGDAVRFHAVASLDQAQASVA